MKKNKIREKLNDVRERITDIDESVSDNYNSIRSLRKERETQRQVNFFRFYYFNLGADCGVF